jgi:RND family efflux transporter MFP subunit
MVRARRLRARPTRNRSVEKGRIRMRMTKEGWATAWPPSGLLLAFWLLAGCGRPAVSSAPEGRAADDGDPSVEVHAVAVRHGSIRQSISAPGSLVSRRQSGIGAEVRAEIVRVHVSEGDRVAAGDVLFELDAAPFEIAVRQAEAGLDLARAEKRQLEADLARARSLKKQQVIPEQEIERLVTGLEVAGARERQASEALAMARHELSQTVVRAPFAGSVAARLADEGTTALVMPQTIVVVLQETHELEAHAAIPESLLASVALGDAALVFVEGLTEPIRTEVSAVSDTIDDATRTYLVKMRVPNAEHRLKAGVFAQVEILPRPKEDVLLVPRDALRTEDGRTRVLVVRDGRAESVAVQIGLVSENDAEVLRGLDAGAEVIVGAAARTIAPGLRVRVVEAPEGAAS